MVFFDEKKTQSIIAECIFFGWEKYKQIEKKNHRIERGQPKFYVSLNLDREWRLMINIYKKQKITAYISHKI